VSTVVSSLGTETTTAPILSSEGHKEVGELVKRATVLRELVHCVVPRASSTGRAFSGIFGKRKEQNSPRRYGPDESRREAEENVYDELITGKYRRYVTPFTVICFIISSTHAHTHTHTHTHTHIYLASLG